MTKNKINDLRDHLFAALEGLADPDKPMDIARAKAISEVAQTVINSAKVEVDFLKISGGKVTTAWIDSSPGPKRLTEGSS